MAISVGRNRPILGRARGVTRRESAGQRVGALFDEFAPMVLAVCRYQLKDPQAAEDAAQETFLSAHRSLLGGTRPRDPAAWLATIARNQCHRARRTASPAPLDEETAVSLVDPADVVAHRADLSDVAGAIAELPDRQREALVLREFCGLSYEQVAAVMSISGAAVDSLLSRARRRLVEQLGDIPRVAQGVLVVPASLREQLSHSVSGLDAAGAAAGAGAGGAATIAGLGSAPVAAASAAPRSRASR
jgi:RNA polymerase sigma-70 factor (ECF subfamily)